MKEYQLKKGKIQGLIKLEKKRETDFTIKDEIAECDCTDDSAGDEHGAAEQTPSSVYHFYLSLSSFSPQFSFVLLLCYTREQRCFRWKVTNYRELMEICHFLPFDFWAQCINQSFDKFDEFSLTILLGEIQLREILLQSYQCKGLILFFYNFCLYVVRYINIQINVLKYMKKQIVQLKSHNYISTYLLVTMQKKKKETDKVVSK